MGCDLQRLANSSQFTGFNPRTRMRCDRIWRISRLKSSMFQSTHPHGVRQALVVYCLPNTECFNPRTRMGCDSSVLSILLLLRCFNPRTRMGCDVPSKLPRRSALSFNPRTRTGCDPAFHKVSRPIPVSIHAPARGATQQQYKNQLKLQFQSTHPHGVRH